MNAIITSVKLGVSALGTGITYLLGGWNIALTTLVVFLAIDYITGVLCAVAKKELSSHEGIKGLAKKLMILMILIVAAMLDKLIGSEQWLCRTAVCYFYVANEGISILENAAKLGVPIPDKLTAALIQVQEKTGQAAKAPEAAASEDPDKSASDEPDLHTPKEAAAPGFPKAPDNPLSKPCDSSLDNPQPQTDKQD